MRSGCYHYCPNPRPVIWEKLAGVIMSLLENESNTQVSSFGQVKH